MRDDDEKIAQRNSIECERFMQYSLSLREGDIAPLERFALIRRKNADMTRCSSCSWYALAAVLAALLGVSFLGGPAGDVARCASIMMLPGVALLFLLFGEHIGATDACLFGGILSPLVMTLAAIPFARTGADLRAVASIVPIACMALLLSGLFLRGAGVRTRPVMPRAWIGALILGLLVIVPLVANPALRIRSDAWFHAAVAESVARGGIPPDDPYFALIQLRYFWAYHVYLLVLRSAVPASLFDLMACINILFFPLYLMSIVAVSARISEKRSGPAFSAALAVLGINVFGSLLLAGRVLFGETRGWDLLRGIIDGGSHYVLTNLAYRYAGSISFFLDKFLVGSSFAMALAMFLAALYFLAGWLAGGDRRELVLAGLFTGSAILFHAIIGLSLLLCGGGALVVLSIAGMRARSGAAARRPLAGIAVLGATALLCVPYLRLILPARELGPGLFTFNGVFLWTVLAAGILPLALLAVRAKVAGFRGAGAAFILSTTGFMMLLGIAARMPFGNINKIVYLVLLPLVVLAGDGAPICFSLLGGRPRLRAVLIVLLTASGVATAALGLTGYIRERGNDAPVPLRDGRIVLTGAEREAYRWMREQTPRQSVFINADRLDIPVLASRRQIYAPERYAEAWSYREDEIAWRRELVASVYGEATLSPEARKRLLAPGFPVYIVMRGADLRRLAGGDGMPGALGAREVFRNDDFIIGAIDAEHAPR